MKTTIIAILAVLLLGLGLIYIDNHLTKIERQIAHLDEEVDEANTGVERLLNKKVSFSSGNDPKNSLAKVELGEVEYDFGKIEKKDGVVSTEFIIKNIGEEDLVTGDIVTSCGCTSASVDKKTIKPNSSGVLKVLFDPNFHEEPIGRFSRSVFVPTNDPKNEELEFKVFVEIKN